MKIGVLSLFLLFLACGTHESSTNRTNDQNVSEQEATVEAHVISRGKFQYVLVISDGRHAGKYLPEKELPEAYCEDAMSLMIDGKILDKKGTVYKPGPTDIPEEDFEIPMIRLDKIVAM